MQNVTQKNNKFWLFIIFIVYPLAAFFYAIKHFAIKKYRVFILLFFMFYGYTFIPIPNSDGSRYQEDFASTTSYSFDDYKDAVVAVFKGEANNPDFYASTLKFVTHSFTSNPSFYFMIAALVYFFVYLKLIETLWDLVTSKGNRYFMSFFIGCCVIYNLSAGVNAIRFPLAFMVFAYGALKLVLTNQRKYLLIAFVSVLIHFALSFSFVFLLAIYLFKFKVKTRVLYLLLLLAVLLGSLFPVFIEQNLAFFGKASESKFSGYTGEGFVEDRAKGMQVWNWYVYFNFYSSYFFTLLSLFLTRLRFFKISFDTTSEKLYVFATIMLFHSLLSGNVVDVISNRFNLLFIFFTLVYLLYLSLKNRENTLLRFLNYIYIPILIINILVRLRGDLYTVNTMVVFGNVITAFFIDITVSIQDFLTN
ncbi:EpsG family protein [Flavobacterium sp. RSB2_4_14]|uniref:EpsG family protein n=1 Tax=Flavobacterium sp. RSB2_4_14 TaxID=3447665 RepID=UPI003F2E61FC